MVSVGELLEFIAKEKAAGTLTDDMPVLTGYWYTDTTVMVLPEMDPTGRSKIPAHLYIADD